MCRAVYASNLTLLREGTYMNILQAFSTTRPRAADLSKLVLVGRLTKDPEVRLTRNQKEFVMYVLLYILVSTS